MRLTAYQSFIAGFALAAVLMLGVALAILLGTALPATVRSLVTEGTLGKHD